ncbi:MULTISPECIES: DUF1501 domain-containing protein [unclassified Lentimonas]|uniref:DUF1501 domain-containing protein n=1 Tax=unclassified Lentimonas TaxID=2630993 RepID=UPI001322F714|nr:MULTISPECIES: DUF1501 domain-containing protein [unclassified Lentimonas]CAA6676701.1 Unannotated [Lentimonas sp. CC4]CAA6684634.1 Unannotated [Lentimonas sp. CC6]CAA7075270.1 Unannotated [Lentimonas sp. CC4]CAA7170655.1 Unannotated [Lentimonas sp. CC21]CAA7182322.1 Unannotated [Lentimonas sp. CC8]
MSKLLKKISRRQFLKAGTCGAMTIGPLVNTIAQLSLVNSAAASSLGGSALVGSDYKALVCIFLRGGCDTNNVLIPRGTNPQAAAYASDRGAVAVPNGIVHPTYNPAGEDATLPIAVPGQDQFGLHPRLGNLAEMFEASEAGFVTNVGTLSEPTTQNGYSTSSLPKQLFSHSDQVTQWMSSIADKPYTSGWGARVADLYNDTWNVNSQTSMMITAAGTNQFMNGGALNQYTVTSSGSISLTGFGTNYSSAINATNGTYNANATGERLKALEQIMQYSHAHIIEEGYTEVVRSARANEAIISEAMQIEANLGIDFDAIWTDYEATGGVAEELKAVARLIAGRECLGNNRQIFFVDLGGFDNHADINDDLPNLLEQLDHAIGAFNAAMKELDSKDTDFAYDKVTTFQASDFNRTWTPNGTNVDSAGTDHAWGSHSFVFGGAVNGGNFYGTYPTLAVGGSDDVPSGSRGRWIPTTSVDQFAAVLANWFGVPANSSEMQTIFPNLDRFQDPFDISGTANLGFL